MITFFLIWWQGLYPPDSHPADLDFKEHRLNNVWTKEIPTILMGTKMGLNKADIDPDNFNQPTVSEFFWAQDSSNIMPP